MGLFHKPSGGDSPEQWEHEVRAAARNHGYGVVKGGRDYVPPADVLREVIGKEKGLTGRALDRAVSTAQQQARSHAN